MANKARRLLIILGKIFPFLLCFILAIHYSEAIVSTLTRNYLVYDDSVILNMPLSFGLARIIRYNLVVVVIAFVISIAIEACKWNLYSVLYLAVNLFEKNYFIFEVSLTTILIVSVLNLLISAFLVYKGCVVLFKK